MIRCTGARGLIVLLAMLSFGPARHGVAASPGLDWPQKFADEVSVKDTLSAVAIARYRRAMAQALASRGLAPRQEFVVVVDRSPGEQHLLLFLGTGPQALYIGASPVSTGEVGHYDHYLTPAGVFEHSQTWDFRAEGAENDSGVRGYGRHGMRVWDFGWHRAMKGWGALPRSEWGDIRLQIHATDPTLLESHLGYRHSKGCIRISSSLNVFLDRYGVLDASYDLERSRGARRPWVWGPDHLQTPYSGRYLVVLDTPGS